MNLSRRRRARALLPGLAIVLLPLSVLSVTASAVQAAPSPGVAARGTAGAVWSPSSSDLTASRGGNARTVNPSEFRGYTLDDAAFAAELAGAPLEGTRAARRGGAVEVVVPAPTGELATFSVVESPTMQKRLQAKHPDIRTYVGSEASGDSISIVVTPTGVHASVRGDHPSWYVDPAYQNDDSLYLSYFGQALPAPEKPFIEPQLDKATKSKIAKSAQPRTGEGPNGLVNQRTYRLAFLTDSTYAEYVAPGLNDGTQDAASNAAVLAAKTLLMARVNQIYNADLAVNLVLINGTDNLNLNTLAKVTGAGGPCGTAACFTAAQIAGCDGPTLTRNRYVVGLLAGSETYDIGHIGLGVNGGGIASFSIGRSAKAQGCTGLPFPVGDFYAIDYVAHEMGHQFFGNHTFNGTQVNCSGGNRSAGASVEPGSGSSVMAYAGICASDDLQPHTDPYFSQRSQTEIGTQITTPPSNINEVQMAALTGYDTTMSFTLSFGSATTLPITGAATVAGVSFAYTAIGIKAAIEAVTGATATVAGLYGATFDNTGFRVTYSGALANANVTNAVLNAGPGFSGFASVIDKGGPTTNGGAITATANHNPTVTAPAAKTIPYRTPFTLTGSATDSDNDSLIYLWEQNDRGATNGTSLVSNTKTSGPLFRVFGRYANVVGTDTLLYNSPGENQATTSPSRTFPDLDQILAGTTNAATGTCPTAAATDTLSDGPALECYSEFLPTAAYVGVAAAGNATPPSLDFRLTARDQRAGGGGTQFADVKLTLAAGTGPFQVTSQAASTSYAGNSSLPVTWDVNGTNTPALAENVKISLSTDGGLTFPNVLAASTPNDGTESVVLPNVSTTTARIKIEAVGNYFFDVNDAPFTIVQALVNQTAPTVSGTFAPGSVLTADPGTWSPSDNLTFTYQWLANRAPIAGATQQTFTLTAAQDGQLVQVQVTASRPGSASASASSSSVRVTSGVIVNTVAPVISGTATVASTLAVSDGTWNKNDLTFSYRWYANGSAIRGANASTYVIPASLAGKAITARVTATRPGSDAVVAVSSNTITPS